MTIPTTQSQITVAGTGAQTVFQFPFVGVSSSDISVSSIASNGSIVSLTSSQYSVSLNVANSNQLWGIGGTITVGAAPAIGTSLLIERILPLTQETSVQNQGNYYAQVTEQALDTLCMEIQQVSARTSQFRGVWTTSTIYNVSDITQDGANGADTLNYYICINANTSGVWATDLANGDWAISVVATVPSTNLPITLSGAVAGSGTTSITTTLAQEPPNSVLCNPSATSGIPSTLTLNPSTMLGRGSSGNIADISLGSGLSMVGTVLNKAAPNYYQSPSAVNPSGTSSSTAYKMMGLGGAATITPNNSGIIVVFIAGTIQTSSNADGVLSYFAYGAGVAPSNGGAVVGTQVGNPVDISGYTNAVPFFAGGIIHGASQGTAYWLDMAMQTVTGGTASVNNLTITAFEL